MLNLWQGEKTKNVFVKLSPYHKIYTKTIKNPHVSMCRTYSPYKIQDDYFSL